MINGEWSVSATCEAAVLVSRAQFLPFLRREGAAVADESGTTPMNEAHVGILVSVPPTPHGAGKAVRVLLRIGETVCPDTLPIPDVIGASRFTISAPITCDSGMDAVGVILTPEFLSFADLSRVLFLPCQ